MDLRDKNVVEEVSCWLRIYGDGSVDRTFSGPQEAKFQVEPVPPHEEFKDGVATRDVVINSQTGLAVRIYIPEIDNIMAASSDKLPILLHHHGGGFCFSQPDWFLYYQFYSRLVRAARVVCVSVYLPLAPEYKLPAACDAAYSAFLWLRDVASKSSAESWLQRYGDFNRVFLVGESAGTGPLHQVAARAGRQGTDPIRLAGAVHLHPSFLRSEPSKSFLEVEETPMLTREMVKKLNALALPDGTTFDHPIVCPMGADAPAMSSLKLPPMLVVIAEKDLLRDWGLEYCEALQKAGKDVEVLFQEGVGHCCFLDKMACELDSTTAIQVKKIVESVTNFIRSH